MTVDPAPTGLYVNERLAAGGCRFHYHRLGSAGSRLSTHDVGPGVPRRARRAPLQRDHARDLDVRRSRCAPGRRRRRASRAAWSRSPSTTARRSAATCTRSRRPRAPPTSSSSRSRRRRRSSARPSPRRSRARSARGRPRSWSRSAPDGAVALVGGTEIADRGAADGHRRRKRGRRRACRRLPGGAGRRSRPRAGAGASGHSGQPLLPLVRRRALLPGAGRARRGGGRHERDRRARRASACCPCSGARRRGRARDRTRGCGRRLPRRRADDVDARGRGCDRPARADGLVVARRHGPGSRRTSPAWRKPARRSSSPSGTRRASWTLPHAAGIPADPGRVHADRARGRPRRGRRP